MKVRILGTGTSTGVPVIGCNCEVCRSDDAKDKRLRTSAYIETGGLRLLIDTGPDFRQQMLNGGITDIDAVLYTHEHRDHIAGMDELRALNFINKKSIDLYAEKNVQEALRKSFPYVFTNTKYPGVPQVNLKNIDTGEFFIKGIKIIPIRVMHYRLPILGFRIGDLSYITDAKYLPPEEKEKIKGSRYIILNALRKKQHISHLSLSESVELLKEFAPQKAYLTHISHQLGKHKEVEKELPENVFLGHDGLEIHL